MCGALLCSTDGPDDGGGLSTGPPEVRPCRLWQQEMRCASAG